MLWCRDELVARSVVFGEAGILSVRTLRRFGVMKAITPRQREPAYRHVSLGKQMIRELRARPLGITAFIVFFSAGTVLSFLAGVSLLFPSTFLAAVWRVNPHGHAGLVRIGLWAEALLFAASISCAAAAIGLWRRAQWGHRIAVVLITINLVSDLANAVTGTEPRAIVGVPIAFALLLYLLSKDVRAFFSSNS